MKKFVKLLLLFLLPFIALLTTFFIFDPFRIIFNYNDYSENLHVIPNRDFVSSTVFLKNNSKYKYNSFIFGSSRTLAFHTYSWTKHIDKKAIPFVFDASGESIFGIYTKIKYIAETKTKIDNCLIIICPDVTFALEVDHTGHLGIKHPKIAKTSWFNFFKTFINAYLDYNFLKHYFKYKITNRYSPTMKGYIEFRNIKYSPTSNDLLIIDQEQEIIKDKENYYSTREHLFYYRDSCVKYTNQQITQKQTSMLEEIKYILSKNNTKFKIVISPLYDQKYMNIKDKTILINIFGEENVYDFSGKNFFTEKKENYYETAHYRPCVGDSIMEIIYSIKPNELNEHIKIK
ncbi:MAG: hypothetical protein JXA68_09275 [Ignavibacteriales bacterium]|nr:hypothetical protein [Ignavibacteriales bacterium]